MNPNSLANLHPPWTSDTVPKNRGRKKGFVSLSNYIGSLGTTPIDDLQAIATDRTQPPLRIAAARQLLIAAGMLEGHRPSDILASTDMIADRTEGKAVVQQRIEHTVGDERPAVLDQARWLATTQPQGDDMPRELPSPGDSATTKRVVNNNE